MLILYIGDQDAWGEGGCPSDTQIRLEVKLLPKEYNFLILCNLCFYTGFSIAAGAVIGSNLLTDGLESRSIIRPQKVLLFLQNNLDMYHSYVVSLHFLATSHSKW